MSAPTYRWVCHRCQLVNEPGASECRHCRFKAIASAQEIAQASKGAAETGPPSDGVRTLKDLGVIFSCLIVAAYAAFQGYVGLTGDRVPIVPTRVMRTYPGVYIHWDEQPIWSALAVACWFVFAALVGALALWWGFSDRVGRRAKLDID